MTSRASMVQEVGNYSRMPMFLQEGRDNNGRQTDHGPESDWPVA